MATTTLITSKGTRGERKNNNNRRGKGMDDGNVVQGLRFRVPHALHFMVTATLQGDCHRS